MRIELQQIRPNFLGAEAIRTSEVWNTTLAFNTSEKIVLWGPSGQGKSTFLRILYGLEIDYEGSLVFDEERLSGGDYRRWPGIRAEKLSLVSQDFRLFEGTSGWDNLKLLPQWAPNIDKTTIEGWAKTLGIETLLNRFPSTWSKGQQQRFTLLRAIVSPFDWILLDEPVSHLDPESAAQSLALMQSVCADRRAGWLVTQQTDDPGLVPDRIFRV